MSMKELYEFLLLEYGTRKRWLSEIAVSLGISQTDACLLTQTLGYHRGKASAITTFESFSADAAAIRILAKL